MNGEECDLDSRNTVLLVIVIIFMILLESDFSFFYSRLKMQWRPNLVEVIIHQVVVAGVAPIAMLVVVVQVSPIMLVCAFCSVDVLGFTLHRLRNFLAVLLSESAALQGKSAFKKENGAHAFTGSPSFVSVASGNNGNRQPASHRFLLLVFILSTCDFY